jgi:putative sigma-54 modulation protein
MLKLNVKGTNLKIEPAIYAYIEEKIGGLDKFIEKVDSVIQAWVEIGLTTKHHQSGNIYRTEVQIRLPGKGVRAEAVGKDIYLVIDAAKDELQEELKKYKEKEIAKGKRGGRMLKKLFRFSPLARFWRKGRVREESS